MVLNLTFIAINRIRDKYLLLKKFHKWVRCDGVEYFLCILKKHFGTCLSELDIKCLFNFYFWSIRKRVCLICQEMLIQ